MTYNEVKDAILNPPNPPGTPLYGARLAWPQTQWIKKCGSGLCLEDGTSYVVNAQDGAASDWIKGGDQPPKR